LDDVLIAIRGIHFAATILLAGAIFFQHVVAQPVLRAADAAMVRDWRAQQAALMWSALGLAVVSGAAWLVRLAASISDATMSDVLSDGTAWTMLTETQFGMVWTVRLAGALALAVCIPAMAKSESAAPWRWVSVAVTAGILAAMAWTGHSGAMSGFAGDMQLACDVLHLIAAGAWLGGLVPLAQLLGSARRDGDGTPLAIAATLRFSLLGMISVGTLVATGVVNTYILVGSVSALTETFYGQLLVAKIGLFTAMLGLAAINRFILLPRLRQAGYLRLLQWNSLAEAFLGMIVIAIVAAIGTMEPAAHDMMDIDALASGGSFFAIMR